MSNSLSHLLNIRVLQLAAVPAYPIANSGMATLLKLLALVRTQLCISEKLTVDGRDGVISTDQRCLGNVLVLRNRTRRCVAPNERQRHRSCRSPTSGSICFDSRYLEFSVASPRLLQLRRSATHIWPIGFSCILAAIPGEIGPAASFQPSLNVSTKIMPGQPMA